MTSIGYSAFSDCSFLTSIAIPDSVTSIGWCAFKGCSSLKRVTIPKSVTDIDDGAFSDCSSLMSITIPEHITNIDALDLRACKRLADADGHIIVNHVYISYCGTASQVVIPNGVMSIGGSAFDRCESLTSVEVPDGVISIGDWAFRGCSALTSITIPESVTSIGNWAFYGCSSLESIAIPEHITNIDALNLGGRLADADGHIIVNHVYIDYLGKASHVVIPDGVTKIGAGAFACYYRFLTSITIPDSVTSIGERAFCECSSLTSITIPDSVTSIGERAFSGCSALTRLTIPAGVKEIGKKINENCSDSLQVIADIDTVKETELKRRVALTFLHEPNAFTFGQDHVLWYIKNQKKQYLPEILKNDLDYIIALLLQEKAITKENIDADFLQPAIEANAVKCTAVLLNWKGRNVTPEEEDRRFERELQKDLYSVGEMKKLWSYEKLEDGTLCITGYKGEATKVEVPPRIGKTAVTAIGKEAFSVEKPRQTKTRKKLLGKITNIQLPDGLISIGKNAF